MRGVTLPTFTGSFGEAEATRLLWRAGFGPKPGQAAQLAALGLNGAVAALTRPAGPQTLTGPAPTDSDGNPLDPVNVWGQDHCWWLDRMVRSDQPLIERMTLVWHSWFATSIEGSTQKLMLAQNRTLRSHWLGNFQDLFLQITKDPAMLLWLSGAENTKYSPNENYGREMMELFSLGADQGYTQHDVHEQSRALTGWTNDWDDQTGQPVNFRYDHSLHDTGSKRIFGRRGNFDWRDSVRLCVAHPKHPVFFTSKLWSYFIPVPAPAADQRALQRLYVNSRYQTRPVVEAILKHPLMYTGPRMITPPAVYFAGLLRAAGQYITTDAWGWIGQEAGQKLFDPPNVAGWDYTRWLDTGTWMGRLDGVNQILDPKIIADSNNTTYPDAETPDQAIDTALGFWSNPTIGTQTRQGLAAFGEQVEQAITEHWQRRTYRILRQNALRSLIATSPDLHTN